MGPQVAEGELGASFRFLPVLLVSSSCEFPSELVMLTTTDPFHVCSRSLRSCSHLRFVSPAAHLDSKLVRPCRLR
jgi:hypothetical protein